MRFFLRGVHISFWLFVFWVAIRVWELSFEVSPLPAWILPVFVFFVLFSVTYFLAKRLFKHTFIDRRATINGAALLVAGAFAWELGLTLWMNHWTGFLTIFTWRFLVGMGVEILAITYASRRLKQKAHEGQAGLDLHALTNPGLAERIKERGDAA